MFLRREGSNVPVFAIVFTLTHKKTVFHQIGTGFNMWDVATVPGDKADHTTRRGPRRADNRILAEETSR